MTSNEGGNGADNRSGFVAHWLRQIGEQRHALAASRYRAHPVRRLGLDEAHRLGTRIERIVAEMLAEVRYAEGRPSRAYIARVMADLLHFSPALAKYAQGPDPRENVICMLKRLADIQVARDAHEWWLLWTGLCAGARFARRVTLGRGRGCTTSMLSHIRRGFWVRAWEDAVCNWADLGLDRPGFDSASVATLEFAYGDHAPVHTLLLNEREEGGLVRIHALALQFRAPVDEAPHQAWRETYGFLGTIAVAMT